MEEDELSDLAVISLFDAVGVILSSQGIADLIEKLLFYLLCPFSHDAAADMLYCHHSLHGRNWGRVG